MQSWASVARVVFVSVKTEEARSRIKLEGRVQFLSLWFEIRAIGISLGSWVFEERKLKGRREQRSWRRECILLFWSVRVCAPFIDRWPSWNRGSVKTVAASNDLLCAGLEFSVSISYTFLTLFQSLSLHLPFKFVDSLNLKNKSHPEWSPQGAHLFFLSSSLL